MKVADAKILLSKWIKNPNLPPLIMVGAAGIGKTQTMLDICQEAEVHMELIRIGSLDSPGDLLGMPDIVDGVTVFTEVEMFKRLRNGGVMFLDELNRCKNVLMDSIMQILDQKKLASYDLSHCSIIGAMNPDTDEYTVNEMDSAVVDRCLFIQVENSAEDVANYMESAGADPRIVEMVMLAEHNLQTGGKFKLPEKKHTPRGDKQLNLIMPLIEDMDDGPRDELISACVGSDGLSTWKNRVILREIPTGKQWLANPTTYSPDKMEPLVQNVLLRRIDSALAEGVKVTDRAQFTQCILKFGKLALSYVIRHRKHINNKLDKGNEQYAEVAKEMLNAMSS